jgi:hypothetical protein
MRAAARSRGERRERYGFKVAADGRTLEEDPAEQMVLAAVRELRAAGLSLTATSAELAKRGMLARSGRPFTVNALMAMETTLRRGR